MATTSFWTQEFLQDIAEALDVSLGRVKVEELQSDPEAVERWQQAQRWLDEARRATAQSPTGVTQMPPFPLTGEQLRSLQRAVDRAVQERNTEAGGSKAEQFMSRAREQAPVTTHGRMLRNLERMILSSWALAILLFLICALNLVELLVFHNTGFWPILGIGVALSAVAIAAWWMHHRGISHHARYVAGLPMQY